MNFKNPQLSEAGKNFAGAELTEDNLHGDAAVVFNHPVGNPHYHVYVTGNRYHGLVELYSNSSMITTVLMSSLQLIREKPEFDDPKISGDLLKLKESFDALGVEYEIVTAKDEHKTDVHTVSYGEGVTWDVLIKLHGGMGYSFFCDFYFLDGKYLKHGIWE